MHPQDRIPNGESFAHPNAFAASINGQAIASPYAVATEMINLGWIVSNKIEARKASEILIRTHFPDVNFESLSRRIALRDRSACLDLAELLAEVYLRSQP
jgi:hypothetical protein